MENKKEEELKKKQEFYIKLRDMADKKIETNYFNEENKTIHNIIYVPQGLNLDEYKNEDVKTLRNTIVKKFKGVYLDDFSIVACHYNGNFIEFQFVEDKWNIGHYKLLANG